MNSQIGLSHFSLVSSLCLLTCAASASQSWQTGVEAHLRAAIRLDLIRGQPGISEQEMEEVVENVLEVPQHSVGIPPVNPHSQRNVILLLVHNLNDGIGDFEHGMSLAEDLAPLKNLGYQLVGIFECEVTSPISGNSPFATQINGRAQYIKNCLETMARQKNPLFSSHFLYQFFEYDEHGHYNEDLRRKTFIAEHTGIKSAFKNSVARLTISYDGHRIAKKFRKYSFQSLLQYGADSAMGLIKQKHLGIKLYPERKAKDPIDRLLEIALYDGEFIVHMIEPRAPSRESIQDYFASHYFLPGYMQTFWAAATFIMAQTHKLYMLHHGLKKKLDFIIPEASIDEPRIRRIIEATFRDFGIAPHEILFLGKKRLKEPLGRAPENYKDFQVRIMSPFLTRTEDFNALFYMSEDGTGASGDNTISQSMSGMALPYFQYKPGPVGRFYIEDLLEGLNVESANLDERELLLGMVNLRSYFKFLISFIGTTQSAEIAKEVNDGALLEISFVAPGFAGDERIEEGVMRKAEAIRVWARKAGALAAKDHVLLAWQYFQSRLFAEYNIRDKLHDFMKKIILENMDSIEARRYLEESEAVKALKNCHLITQPLALSSLIKLTATPSIIKALLERRLKPSDIVEWEYNTLLNYS